MLVIGKLYFCCFFSIFSNVEELNKLFLAYLFFFKNLNSETIIHFTSVQVFFSIKKKKKKKKKKFSSYFFHLKKFGSSL